MKKKLLGLSFIEGAAVMAAELCGAKLLAPVFGSSLFVWASVMGITLAALAGGYFFGGWISQRAKNNALYLFRILNAAALFLILMPLLSHYLVPRISYLPFLPGVVFSTSLLLFLPVFFLGATSPLFILLQTHDSHNAGKVSGTVYAISTAGGILATFLCGFYLIPQWGLTFCLLLFGTGLFVANLVVFRIFKFLHVFIFLSLGYLHLQFTYTKSNALFLSDGMMGRVEVKDITRSKENSYRILTVNDIVQSEMNLSDCTSTSAYVSMLDVLIPAVAERKEALVLGLGGGLTANLLKTKNYQTEGVELDGRILKAAKTFFFLHPEVNTIEQDARYFLNACNKKYALVLVDVFKGEEQPSHVLTRESLRKLKSNLNDSALLFINWHGYTGGDLGLGTSILINTLQKAGFTTKLCSYSADEHHRNILVVAALHPLTHMHYELNEVLTPTNLINSDDFPLLERYNAEANKTWRLNYLRYYQNKK